MIIHGVSVDPAMPRLVRALLIRLAHRAEAVTVRDRASAELLATWGVAADCGPDLSAGLWPAPPEAAARLLEGLGLDPARPIVGLCLTAVEPELATILATEIPQLVEALPDVQFLFVPMSLHPRVARHNDLVFARELQRCAPGLAVLDASLHPAEMLGLFHLLSAAVCMRFHSLLFAERAGVPILGVPYAGKCRAWLRERSMDAIPPYAAALGPALRDAADRQPVAALGLAAGGWSHASA